MPPYMSGRVMGFRCKETAPSPSSKFDSLTTKKEQCQRSWRGACRMKEVASHLFLSFQQERGILLTFFCQKFRSL